MAVATLSHTPMSKEAASAWQRNRDAVLKSIREPVRKLRTIMGLRRRRREYAR